MGGPGSGSWYRYDTRRTVEQCRALDAGRWAQEGIISPGRRVTGVWGWFRDAQRRERTASIQYETECGATDGTARLIYRHSPGGRDAWQDMDYRIALTSTPSNLKIGRLWFFVCPAVGCGRRAKKLYLGGRYFACRRCYNLTYESCNTSHQYERLARALAAELGGNPRELAGLLRDWSKEDIEMMQLAYQATAVSKKLARILI